ncbi:MAG: translation initiation factor IF-3 [Phycisphaeraceae bacterium]|nr:translation initiation factor IF-3 [Phycisphaeraceae bacterium]MBX3366267.1 translation initiation factor IF-3 [Phycisphaeraceae bacterium]QYK48723.1 MAG: translation initiation factor IF-3 [Phycisphaeraceae bacterium]
MIRISPIRLIGAENEQIGVVETYEAMRMAQEQGLDLVEIVPDSRPPVCKIMDYGKHKYELSQKERKSRAASKSTEMKEIRLGRSVKIDPHDVKIRVDQSRRFLMAGHKVTITQRFRGREMMHRGLGLDRLEQICRDLSDIAKIEMDPRWLGKQASIILAPDRVKIEALKRQLAKQKQDAGIADAEEAVEAELHAQAQAAQDAIDQDAPDDDDDDADGVETGAQASGSDAQKHHKSAKKNKYEKQEKKKDFMQGFDPNQIG